MSDEQLKTKNTKSLAKKLVLVTVVALTYQLATVEDEQSSSFFSDLKLSAVETIKDSKQLEIEQEEKPIDVSMTFSFDIDMGKHLNKLVRKFLSRR